MQDQQQSTSTIDKQAVISGFNKAAKTYDQAAFLQQEIGDRLIERLDWIKTEPKVILDLGSGTGYCTNALKKRYPKAQIIALDLAQAMLLFAKKKVSQDNSFINHILPQRFALNKSVSYVCADAEFLPLKSNSIDLIFSNLSIQWCENYEVLFSEFARVLNPSGFVQYSTFGVDTLLELKKSWQKVDQQPRVNEFIDMHDLADIMLASGLAEPIVDAEHLVIEYTKVTDLVKDLKSIGAHNHLAERQKGLQGKHKFSQMLKAYEAYKLNNQKYPATYELIYGHAWAKDLSVTHQKKNEQVVSFTDYQSANLDISPK